MLDLGHFLKKVHQIVYSFMCLGGCLIHFFYFTQYGYLLRQVIKHVLKSFTKIYKKVRLGTY